MTITKKHPISFTKITVLSYREPKKSERTWPMIKGAISNRGSQRNKLNGTTIDQHQR